jgi:hypothetical protein
VTGPAWPPPISPIRRRLYVVGVSAYLMLAGLWLILTARLPVRPLLAFVGTFLRPRWRLALRRIEPESGHCYVAPVPRWIPCDRSGASGLELYEDGIRLPLGHTQHDTIRQIGLGRYSHWDRCLYFSASDNSDPRSNGRRYQLIEARW